MDISKQMNPLAKLLSVFGINKREQLYAYATTQIGLRECFRAPIAYGCADSLNTVFKGCFGQEIGGDVSTLRLYNALQASSRFIKVISVDQSLRGDIIIAPTSMGNDSVPNGHCGILREGGVIMSNNSDTGLWDTHLNINTWIARYIVQGGYPFG